VQRRRIGVFQVESRAQMNMLPRLKPRELLRSGHPGGDRAARPDPGRYGPSLSAPPQRAEKVEYPSPTPPHDPDELRGVLGRTYGVPLFQEQAMKLAMVAADFTRRGQRPAPRNGDVPQRGTIDGFEAEDGRGHDRARL
jgi:error-prone DNA polymerase